MTIGEVEEFLWSLSTTLEGEIGNWQIRFSNAVVSVRADPAADRLAISAPITFFPTPALQGSTSPAGVRYQRDGTDVRAVFATRLSSLAMNGLQAGFQQVVDSAKQAPDKL